MPLCRLSLFWNRSLVMIFRKFMIGKIYCVRLVAMDIAPRCSQVGVVNKTVRVLAALLNSNASFLLFRYFTSSIQQRPV